uniref:F20B17.15 n=1 Tax=Arabidopsis thaliana TaxID=3702 RepID=Q9MA05_ARATH|nr:F20B17.15 [Arabidopsis thaliana]
MFKKATLNLSLAPLLLVFLFLLSCVVHGVDEKKILSVHNNIWSPKKSYEASTSCFSRSLGQFYFHQRLTNRRDTVSFALV